MWRLVWSLLAALACAVSAVEGGGDFSRPTSYDSFVSVDAYPTVADAIQNEQHLYFPAGEYFLDNPIVIDRAIPLFLHGGDRMKTRLRANDTASRCSSSRRRR